MELPFQASDAKIERSARHLEELRHEISSYFRRGGSRIVVERDAQMNAHMKYGDYCVFMYRRPEPIPLLWSVIIGDVIHNMRSALDVLACDVYLSAGGRAEKVREVYFPFCQDKADLSATIKRRRLNSIGATYIEAIHVIAPYYSGNDGLRALHDLDVLDKHQSLVPTLSVATLPWPTGKSPEGGPPDFQTTLSQDGQRVFLMPKSFCPLEYGSVVNADFLVLFNVGVFKGRRVVEQLESCLKAVRAILDLFRRIHETAATAEHLPPKF